jgi:hypothetical protein
MTMAEHSQTGGPPGKSVGEASVSIAGMRYKLPLRKGTLGPAVVDITTVLSENSIRPRFAP